EDTALQEGVRREGAGWAEERIAAFGRLIGRAEVAEKADQANRHGPELRPFDRYGMRIDRVEYHPAYHDLMALAVGNEVAGFAWNHEGPGAHVGHMALTYLISQVECGVMCSMAMTYAAVPALRASPAIAEAWVPRALSGRYDGRDVPVEDKPGATVGMFMTEKQGGSDVRSNSTRARPAGSGADGSWRLTGHKYFCSAPMSDAFLTLARTDAGISCFLLPRWTPEGERNAISIQHLKDKLGNRSNASVEIELEGAWAVMVGEDGRGIRTIIDMVQGNRLYCAVSSAALMRQGVVQALHHTRHRSAFQRRLADQPLMRNVLADLALEAEAALALGLRTARAVDEAGDGPEPRAFARIGTAIAKYWVCKRAPGHAFEALECHGGPGYVEDGPMARLYREAPLNSIWEGSGNVLCLDVLRAMAREEETVPALLAELDAARGGHPALDRAADALRDDLSRPEEFESGARALTERMALALQASLLVRHAPQAVADAFCTARLGDRWTGAYGTLPTGADTDAILARALPAA
ncbi:MAG: acyl-CoA dehydrogenase family protein, partial [Alphaproteobacteria bacterium]|nr:acyl-CoA dehydrogenase family protein [Alphaproteobacteria bacterium]